MFDGSSPNVHLHSEKPSRPFQSSWSAYGEEPKLYVKTKKQNESNCCENPFAFFLSFLLCRTI